MVSVKDLFSHVGVAKHTEEDRIFLVYEYEEGDLLLRDKDLDVLRKIVTIPPRFQRPELVDTVWEHFKSAGGQPMVYHVRGLGVDLDRFETFVLYAPLYERGLLLMEKQRMTFLARPEEMFFSEVERDGYQGPRFRRIG